MASVTVYHDGWVMLPERIVRTLGLRTQLREGRITRGGRA
jgi:hypothetical protein